MSMCAASDADYLADPKLCEQAMLQQKTSGIRLRRILRKTVWNAFKRARARGEIRSVLKQCNTIKLNLGCGRNIVDSWVNVDLFPRTNDIFMDATKTWPLPDESVQAILCEHMIEHVRKTQAAFICNEAFRVLAPGGYLRMITPDIHFFCNLVSQRNGGSSGELYLKGVGDFFGSPNLTRVDAINLIFYEHEHRYIYSFDELARMLRAAGFPPPLRTPPGAPLAEIFVGVEGHGHEISVEINQLEAFALEVRK